MKPVKSILIISILLLVPLFTGCQKDFLETSPSASISDVDAFKTTDGAQTALNGIYYHLRQYNGGGSGRSDDWGIPALIMTNDAAAGQEVVVWGGWYTYDYNLWGHTRGDIFKASLIWRFFYFAINNANLILLNIDDAYGSETDKAAIKGQALALRAYSYFNLIRYFQHTYIIAQNMPGVPIYLTPATAESTGNPRGTVEEVYTRIVTDLNEAVPLLENYSRGSRKTTIDRNVALGILAEVYLTMNRWNDAAQAAHDAREGYTLMTRAEYHSGFNDINNHEWMWGGIQTPDQNMGDYSPFAMWTNPPETQRNGFTFNCFFLNDLFVNTFDSEDIRFNGKIQPDPWGAGLYITSKFYDKEDLMGDLVYMRASSMYLMEIEALARAGGRESEAQELLWELQDARNAVRSSSTGDELIEDILLERRKELYGEGYAWFDMIRNQKPMYRAGTHQDGLTPATGVEHWPARSWRYVYQIPFNEISNNKAMTDGTWPAGDQTPFSGVYNPS